jgi:chromosome segregation ATPase
MELAEAVRIVREIVRPLAWARERWSGHGWVRDTRPADALDAVLAALERLFKEWDAVVAALGPHAHPGLSPSESVAQVVAEVGRLRGAIEIWQREAQSGWESARIAEAERNALDRDFAAFRATALETSNHMHDVIRERDALRVDLAQARSGWAAAGALLEATRAERDALRDKLSSVTENHIRERNAATAAEAERDALRAALRELIRGIDAWDAAVAQIIERHVNHKWEGLERAREILRDTAPEVKP